MAFVVSLLFIGSLVTPVFAKDATARPRAVIERYLQLDADAARLSESNWPAMQPLVTWPKPLAWDKIVVIESYKIDKIAVGSTRAQASVSYEVLGELSNTFTAGHKHEAAVYHLNLIGNDWKVDGPALKPHVSYEVMKTRLAGNPLLQQIEAARQAVR